MTDLGLTKKVDFLDYNPKIIYIFWITFQKFHFDCVIGCSC